MRLLQFHHESMGQRLGAEQDGKVYDLTSAVSSYSSFEALLKWSRGDPEAMAQMVAGTVGQVRPDGVYDLGRLDNPPDSGRSHLLMPLTPPEVWGFGVTYQRSAEVRDTDAAQAADAATGIYDRVYQSPRPECFFKATAARCVGPHGAIGIRSDSELTATEPELAYVLGAERQIVGYTAVNDVSAWDLERENPLYLPQSKIYGGCCAVGPAITLAAGGPDPYRMEIGCRIFRGRQLIYSDSTNSSRINRRFEELNEFLYRDNPIPVGTLVSTGTGIMVPNEYALADGDVVEIEISGIGVLRNPVRKLGG